MIIHLTPDQLAARKMRREVSRRARAVYAAAREEGWSREEILQTIRATTGAETIRRRMEQRSGKAGDT